MSTHKNLSLSLNSEYRFSLNQLSFTLKYMENSEEMDSLIQFGVNTLGRWQSNRLILGTNVDKKN